MTIDLMAAGQSAAKFVLSMTPAAAVPYAQVALPCIGNGLMAALPIVVAASVSAVVDKVAHEIFELEADSTASKVVMTLSWIAGISASVCILPHVPFVSIVKSTGLAYIGLLAVADKVEKLASRVLPFYISRAVRFVVIGVVLGDSYRKAQLVALGILSVLSAIPERFFD